MLQAININNEINEIIQDLIKRAAYRVGDSSLIFEDNYSIELLQHLLRPPFAFNNFQLCFLEDEESCEKLSAYLFVESNHIGLSQVDTVVTYLIQLRNFKDIYRLIQQG